MTSRKVKSALISTEEMIFDTSGRTAFVAIREIDQIPIQPKFTKNRNQKRKSNTKRNIKK